MVRIVLYNHKGFLDSDNGLATGTAVASFGRRRRSVDNSPLESAASIAIHVVAPKTASCGPPSPVSRAARRANCTHGATIGSVCRQKCDLGFESAGGRNAATRICQETITDRIDDFYFGVAPKWNPGKTECVGNAMQRISLTHLTVCFPPEVLKTHIPARF